MNGAEQGFLLLTCRFGVPNRPVLTTAQLRTLWGRVLIGSREDQQRDLDVRDLMMMGYSTEQSARIMNLLDERRLLELYTRNGLRCGITALTPVSPCYPAALKEKLGWECPGTLWAKGDLSLIGQKCIAVVGNREIAPDNLGFARLVGRMAARQGYVLISGNARGADMEAQNACLQAGGKVISVVADRLDKQPQRENVLYLSEEGYDSAFSFQRALSRNRVIHALAEKVFVAQCSQPRGGTWDGTLRNLKAGWSPVFVFSDGSAGVEQLLERGANAVNADQLKEIDRLQINEFKLW